MGMRDWLIGDRQSIVKIGAQTKLPQGAQVLPLPIQLNIPQVMPTGGSHQITDLVAGYWFSALSPIKPMAPKGQRVRGYEIQPGANIAWTPKTEIDGSGP